MEMAGNIQRINFTIHYPDFKGRNTFSILKITHFNDGTKKKAEKLEIERIDAINQEWEKSTKTETKRDELLRLVKEIRTELHRSQLIKDGKIRLVKIVDNQKVLEDFISERIEGRKIVNPKGHEQDFTRAVLVIDRANLSLKTSTRKDLQKAVDKITKNSLHRRVCSRINALMTFIGRNIRLEPLEYNARPSFFNESEFLNLVQNIHPPKGFEEHTENIRNLFYTLFYTGMRIGEAFALYGKRKFDPASGRDLNLLDGTKIVLHSQMLKDSKKITSTKTGEKRIAYVIQNHTEKLKAWANLDEETKKLLRDIEYSVLIKRAGRSTFPNDAEKRNLKAHDCRHSYAIHLLNSGVNISLTAKSLGNSVLVCEKYYLPHALTDDGIEMIHHLMSQPRLKVAKAS
ncbi:MAG: tyrosine-type recombinase/integrase [Pseudobdellovibrionaceae bacterium]